MSKLEGGAMKDKVLKWMLIGHVGASSKAMAAHLCGFPCRGDYPRDPDDFYLCMMLLDAVPEARALLPKMAEVNRYWAALVSRWDEIEAAFRDERRRPGVFYSIPKTYDLISEIINKADKVIKPLPPMNTQISGGTPSAESDCSAIESKGEKA